MKRTNNSIESLPQRLSNATLSGGDGRLLPDNCASVDLNQLDSKTKIAAAVGRGQSHGQSAPNPASRQPNESVRGVQ